MLTAQDIKELRASMGKAWESAYFASAKEPPYKPDLVLADKAAFDLFVSWVYDNKKGITDCIMFGAG